jgi:hypothetical protein
LAFHSFYLSLKFSDKSGINLINTTKKNLKCSISRNINVITKKYIWPEIYLHSEAIPAFFILGLRMEGAVPYHKTLQKLSPPTIKLYKFNKKLYKLSPPYISALRAPYRTPGILYPDTQRLYAISGGTLSAMYGSQYSLCLSVCVCVCVWVCLEFYMVREAHLCMVERVCRVFC